MSFRRPGARRGTAIRVLICVALCCLGSALPRMAYAQYETREGIFELTGQVAWSHLDGGTASAESKSALGFGVGLRARPAGYEGRESLGIAYSFFPGGGGLGGKPTIHQLGIEFGGRFLQWGGLRNGYGLVFLLGGGLVAFDPPDSDPDDCRPEDGCFFEGVAYAAETIPSVKLGVGFEALLSERWLLRIDGGANIWIGGENADNTDGNIKPAIAAGLGFTL